MLQKKPAECQACSYTLVAWWVLVPNFRVPPDYQKTLDRLRAAGLSNADLREAGRITDRKLRTEGLDNPWRYFCGVAWNMADDRMRVDFSDPVGHR